MAEPKRPNRLVFNEAMLNGFMAGKLEPAAEEKIASLLEARPELLEKISAKSGDGFLKRLREVQQRSSEKSPAQVKAEVIETAPIKKSPTKSDSSIPEALANYAGYKIVKELGRGGMGVVYLAKNIQMDRLEVLKVLNERLLDHEGAKERFLREIRAVSKLSHANIVTSYSILPLDNLLVFAMEYVHGIDLHQYTHKYKPLSVGLACSFAKQIAEGLEHAHDKRLVHRDIKPSNVIVYKSSGQLQLKILDFGLAKATSEEAAKGAGLTQDGTMLGTPEYMSPEQTLNAAKADIRADIYSLGCTLYYMLTGKPPFAGTHGAVLVAHAQREPTAVNLVRPDVPAELVAVVGKMLAKDVRKRYQTPSEVANALTPFVNQTRHPPKPSTGEAAMSNTVNDLNGPDRETSVEAPLSELPLDTCKQAAEPQQDLAALAGSLKAKRAATQSQPSVVRTKAKPRFPKWFIPTVATLGAMIMFFTVWQFASFTFKTPNGTIVVENMPADAEVLVDGEKLEIVWNAGKDKAEVRIAAGSHQLHVLNQGNEIYGNKVSVKGGDKSIIRLRGLKPDPTSMDDVRSTSKVPPALGNSISESSETLALELSPILFDVNSNEAAKMRAQMYHQARLADKTAAGKTLVRQIQQARWPIDLLERSNIPPDELFAAGGGESKAAPSELVAVIGNSRWKPAEDIVAFDVSPNAQSVISGARDGVVSVWNPQNGILRRQIAACNSELKHLKLNQSGTSFLVCSTDRKIRHWEVASGKLLQIFEGHEADVVAAVFSSDENAVYSTSTDSKVCIWDTNTGVCKNRLETKCVPVTMASHPSKPIFSVGGKAGSLIVMNAETGNMVKEIQIGKGPVCAIDFSPNGFFLAGGLQSGEITVWEINNDFMSWKQQKADYPPLFSVRFGGDSKSLGIGDIKSFALWKFDFGKTSYKGTAHHNANVAPLGSNWIAGWESRWIALYDDRGRILNPDSGPIYASALSPDGSSVAVCVGTAFKTELWKLPGLQPKVLPGNGQWDTSVGFSTDGNTVYTAGGNWHTKIWDTNKGQQKTHFGAHKNWITDLDVSSDGTRLCTGAFDATSRVWDSKSGKQLHLLKRQGENSAILSNRFSPDATKIITSNLAGNANIWDSSSGGLLASLPKSIKPRSAVAFRPFSDEVAATDGNNVSIHSVADGKAIRSLIGHQSDVLNVDFNLDGSMAASRSKDGTIRIWNADTGEQIEVIRMCGLTAETDAQARFTPDGRHIIAINGNGTCCVLRLKIQANKHPASPQSSNLRKNFGVQ